jgi:putative transcriptional regulator
VPAGSFRVPIAVLSEDWRQNKLGTEMDETESGSGYLTGQLLIAMPAMQDPRFEKSVIYMCIHNADGAMGLIVNRALESLTFRELLSQLELGIDEPTADFAVQFGGPVETGHGFVLHTLEYEQNGTIVVDDKVGLTAMADVLRDLATDQGPQRAILALGYAGWGPGQLDSEIQQNAWLNVPADDAIIFDVDIESRWEQAIAKIGVDVSLLSGEHGHA